MSEPPIFDVMSPATPPRADPDDILDPSISDGEADTSPDSHDVAVDVLEDHYPTSPASPGEDALAAQWELTFPGDGYDPDEAYLILANDSGARVTHVDQSLIESVLELAIDQNRVDPGRWPQLDPDTRLNRTIGQLSQSAKRASGADITTAAWNQLPGWLRLAVFAAVAAILIGLLIFTVLQN